MEISEGRGTLVVVVGSGNRVKVAAVEAALARLSFQAEVRGFAVPSGVGEQPLDHAETRSGARARCMGARAAGEAAGVEVALSVGIESGLYRESGEWFETTWVCLRDGSGVESWASGASFPVPTGLVADLEAGCDLTEAMEHAVGIKDIGTGTGFYGHLTNETYSRSEVTRDAVVVALSRWVRPELWS